MLLYLTDDFLRAGTAVSPEAIYAYLLGIQQRKEPLMSVCLMEAYVRVTIAVLDIDNHITHDICSRPVAGKLLVSRLSDDTAASLTKCLVDNRWKHGVKLLHD